LLRNARRTAIGLALAAVLLITGACSALGGSSTDNTSSGPLEKSSIKVTILSSVDAVPLWMALDEGYFKAEGLDVTLDLAETGALAQTKVISGGTDIAMTTYPLFFVAVASGAADLKLVADGTSASPRSNQLLTAPNSPVKTIEDIAGRRVAITSKNATSDILTRSVLRDHNVDASKVQWVPMGLPNMAAALQQGQVDAIYQPEPYITQAAKSIHATPVIDVASGATLDFPILGYTSGSKWIADNPKTMAAFQRALMKGAKTATDDRAKVEPLLVKYVKVDADIAALVTLPAYHVPLDARRIQRVPDLLQTLGAITTPVDAAARIAPQLAA
jgi:NitT/TauT family transport system substrate-binding protein